MLYCGRCQFLCNDKRCPQCGNKKLRMPLENDPVYLFTGNENQAICVGQVLKENGIPYEMDGNQGAGMAMYTGNWMETKRIYVPYGAYLKSRELAEHVLESLRQTGAPLEQSGSEDE